MRARSAQIGRFGQASSGPRLRRNVDPFRGCSDPSAHVARDSATPTHCSVPSLGATFVVMARAGWDSASWHALRLALIGLALPVVAFIPDFVQEVSTMLFLALVGGAVAVFALVQGVGAFRARRAAHESPAMASSAIAIAVLPILGALFLLPSLGCYFGESCGGG